MKKRQIHSRGYLPHINGADFQFITYRLNDSLPQKVIDSMLYFDIETKTKQINNFLDKGFGSCILKHPNNALIVIENWEYFNGERYDIHAYVVMPNHVHILIKVFPNYELTQIVHSWKSFTAKKLSKKIGQNIWYRDYFDRYIRNQQHYNKVVQYIRENPIKAGLIDNSQEWPFLFILDMV